jgi:hypothetical protein
MERAGSFTCVSGWGQVAVGLTAFPAAFLSARSSGPESAIAIWIVTAAVAVTIAFVAILGKARRLGIALDSATSRRFLHGFLPPLGAAVVLTVMLVRAERFDLLRPLWLVLYGTGIITGGAFSIPVVPIMGMVIAAIGIAAVLSPPGWSDLYMASGFGAVHVAFGVVIARRHGG